MGHQQQQRKSSSSTSTSDERNEEQKEKKEQKEHRESEEKSPRARTISGNVNLEETKFGEQLQDDLINSFCDKLQAACPRKLEALLAIQFLLITGADEVKKHVSGRREAIQVIYDKARIHYVLVHYNPKNHRITLYDSLQTFDENGYPRVIDVIAEQINHLFGHLYEEYIPVSVDYEYEPQTDNFSCGYRVIASLVLLARKQNPAEHRYGRTAILKFLGEVLREPNVTWQMFENAQISKVRKSYTGVKIVRTYLRNSTWTGSESRSSASKSNTQSKASSRASSTTSVNCSQRPSAGSSPLKTEVLAESPNQVMTTPPQSVAAQNSVKEEPQTDWMTHIYGSVARSFSFLRFMGRRKSDLLSDIQD